METDSKFTSCEGVCFCCFSKLSLWKPGEDDSLSEGHFIWGWWREKTLLITDGDYWWTKQLLISNHDESKDRGTIGTNTGRHGYRGTGKNTQEQVQDWYGTTRDFRKHLSDRISGKMAAIKSPQNLEMKTSGQGRPKIKILLYPHNFIILVFGQWISFQDKVSNASTAKRGFNRSWQNTI